MKSRIIIFALLVILHLSCSQNEGPPTAAALSSSSSDITYKRSYENLVAQLYKELADKDPALKRLEAQINALEEGKADSSSKFDDFNQKNLNYISAAKSHGNVIKDSVLSAKVKAMILKSETKYRSLIQPQELLLTKIRSQEIALNDLHLYLKVARTIPIIEKYQRDNHKSTIKPLAGYLKEVNKAIKLADTLAKK
jgi:hypothetical protein